MAAGLALATTVPSDATEPADPLPWRAASLEAKKLFLTGTTQLELSPVDGAPGEVRLVLESAFVGRRTTSEIRIDRQTGATLERRKTKHGGDPYRKTYRFGADVIREERVSPENDRERDRGPEGWTHRKESEIPIPEGCVAPIHPEGLFWLLATSAPEPGEPPLERCAFTGDGFVRIRLEAVTDRDQERTFEDPSGGGDGTIAVRVLRLEGQALDGAAADDLDFLGLEGDIGLVIDTATGAPIEVTGDVPPLGGVRVQLRRLEI